MLSDKDPEKASRVMQAMLQMHKIDIPTLKRAYEQKNYELFMKIGVKTIIHPIKDPVQANNKNACN